MPISYSKSFFENNFADFQDVQVKNLDFIQSLLVFEMSNIYCYSYSFTCQLSKDECNFFSNQLIMIIK